MANAMHGAARVFTHSNAWFGPALRSDCRFDDAIHYAGAVRRGAYDPESMRYENQALRQRLGDLEEELRQATEDLAVLRAGHRILQRSISAWFPPA